MALLKIAETSGYRFKLIESVIETNNNQRAHLGSPLNRIQMICVQRLH
ncbi:hypothetical protein CGLO_12777 [Colletotrichum gloeosporioides Cg-14]|uniref:Uncharacterized protein n=1 Tax=Colletotrichum gloeosporioides (strain Cg-14) TaxID=1237896 RepID=T0L8T5_COLGC|nr:hypothetical protein CGLO_12777 [Colletotrichum gloeosporioides Cg-14]